MPFSSHHILTAGSVEIFHTERYCFLKLGLLFHDLTLLILLPHLVVQVAALYDDASTYLAEAAGTWWQTVSMWRILAVTLLEVKASRLRSEMINLKVWCVCVQLFAGHNFVREV